MTDYPLPRTPYMNPSESKHALYLTAAIAAIAAAWLAASWFLVRPLIVNIYYQQSLPALNQFIVGQAVYPVGYYLDKIERMTWLTLPVVILFTLVVLSRGRRFQLLAVIVLLLVAIEVRLPGLFSRAISDDESITLLDTAGNPGPSWPKVPTPARLAKPLYEGVAPLSQITQELREGDVHPPVYFWGVALWRSWFGYSIETARVFSLICSIGAVLVFYLLLRAGRIDNPLAPTMVYALSAVAVSFGGTARNYALASLWVGAGALLAYLAVDAVASRRRRAFVYAIASAVCCGVAFQTHYLALFPVGVVQLWLCIRLWRSWRAVAVLAPVLAAGIGAIGFSVLLSQLGVRPEQNVGFLGFVEHFKNLLQSSLAVLWAPAYLPATFDYLSRGVALALVAASMMEIIRHWSTINRSLWILLLGLAVTPLVGLFVMDFIFDKNNMSPKYFQMAAPALAAVLILPVSRALSSKKTWLVGAALLAMVTGLQMLGINWGDETDPTALPRARSLAQTIQSSGAVSRIVVIDEGGGRTNPGSLVYELDPETLILCFGKDSDPEQVWSMIERYKEVWITFSWENDAKDVRTRLLDRIRKSGLYSELPARHSDRPVFRFGKITETATGRPA